MAARVVDVLEAVEIEEQHRQHGAAAARLVDRLRQVVREIQPVGQPGQLVVMRHVVELLLILDELLLGLAAQRDIVGREGEHVAALEDQAMTQWPRLPAVTAVAATLPQRSGTRGSGPSSLVERWSGSLLSSRNSCGSVRPRSSSSA